MHSVLNVKALLDTFNQEKKKNFSDGSFAALHLALLPRPRHALLRTLGLRHAALGYLTQGFLEFAAAVCGG